MAGKVQIPTKNSALISMIADEVRPMYIPIATAFLGTLNY